MSQTVTFRPTEKALVIIKETTKQKDIRNRNHAINYLIEQQKPLQLEQPKTEELGGYFSYPPNLFCEKDHQFYTKETVLEECRNCRNKPSCRAWNPK